MDTKDTKEEVPRLFARRRSSFVICPQIARIDANENNLRADSRATILIWLRLGRPGILCITNLRSLAPAKILTTDSTDGHG
jgi:hypothetical protein